MKFCLKGTVPFCILLWAYLPHELFPNNNDLIKSLTEINPTIQWILDENPELSDEISTFWGQLSIGLNNHQVLLTVADVVMKYNHRKDMNFIFDKLEHEILLHTERFQRRNTSSEFDALNDNLQFENPFPVLLEDVQINENDGSCHQESPAIASTPDGSFVVAWVDYRTIDADIYVRCFDNTAQPLGPGVKVNCDDTNTDQLNPAVAMDLLGNFVVVWEDDRDGGNLDVYARCYNSFGAPLDTDFQVNAPDNGTDQYEPKVAMAGDGSFVIVWRDKRTDDGDIYAQRYDNQHSPIAANFLVHDDLSTGEQNTPDISMSSNGDFTICWIHSGDVPGGVYARQYDNQGAPTSSSFCVYAGDAAEPAIDMDDSGNFAVVCMTSDFYKIIVKYYSGDQAAHSDIENELIAGPEFFYRTPDVLIDKNGQIVVAYNYQYRLRSEHIGWIYLARFNQQGQQTGNRLSFSSGNWPLTPAIAAYNNSDKSVLVTWQDDRNGKLDYDIFAQRFTEDNQKIGADFRINDDHGSSNQFMPIIGGYDDGNFLVGWEDHRTGWNGFFAQRYNECLEHHEHNVYLFEIDTDFVYPEVMLDKWSGDNDRQGNFGITYSGSWWSGIIKPESIVANMFDTQDQLAATHYISSSNMQYVWSADDPDMVFRSNGDYIITYTEYWDAYDNIPQGTNIFAKQFDSANNLIRKITEIGQGNKPRMAIAADGFFVITWEKDSNIYMRCFNPDGTSNTPIIIVNDDQANFNTRKAEPAIVINDNSIIVITWMDYRNGEADIFYRLFDCEGTPIDGNYIVNDDSPGNAQYSPVTAAHANGDFIIAWEDYRNGNADIYAQRYRSNGEPDGTNYRVNNDGGDAEQRHPKVDIYRDNVYFAWQDNRIPNQGWDVFARVEKFSSLPEHWNFTFNTGNNANIILPTSINPNLDGEPLKLFDYIGVFNANGLCCGWKQWQNQNLNIVAWGDNDRTPETDGFKTEEPIKYRLYRMSDQTEWDIVDVSYSEGTGFYSPNAFMILNNFHVTGTTIPVELSTFEALIIDRDVLLKWRTETEINSYGFQVDRSTDKLNFLNIGFVESNGTSSIPREYNYVDDGVKSGTYYYRLKQIDNDGSFEYSAIIGITLEMPAVYHLDQNYPNPFNPETTITFSLPVTEKVIINIYNIHGQLVTNLCDDVKNAGVHRLTWNAMNMPGGLYFCRFQAGAYSDTKKFLLIK